MNEHFRPARPNGISAQDSADDFMSLQDAAKEFGIYPSVARAWVREGRMPVDSVDNFRVRRSALIAAIEASEKGASPAAPPEEGTVALARRILEVCASPTPDNWDALEREARAILDGTH